MYFHSNQLIYIHCFIRRILNVFNKFRTHAMNFHRCLILSVSVFLSLSTPTWAWNKAGHMVTAAIAYDTLKKDNPQALAALVAILKQHPQYNELFEDKLSLFVELLKRDRVTWSGSIRSGLSDAVISPAIESGTLRTWIGVGGSPQSVVRAARYGLPLTLAIIGGNPARFRPFVDLYFKALEQFGHAALPVAVHSPGHVAATDAEAREELWPHHQAMMTRIGAERGWPPITRQQFEHAAGPDGALYVGSPETVAAKVVNTARLLGLSRFNLKYSAGTLRHSALMKSIELIGTQVAPRVREMMQ